MLVTFGDSLWPTQPKFLRDANDRGPPREKGIAELNSVIQSYRGNGEMAEWFKAHAWRA